MKAFEDAKNKKIMGKFFNRIIKEKFPKGSILKELRVTDVGGMTFKKALKYDLAIETPRGKIIKKVIRGNVPSKDTWRESMVADKTKKILFQHNFASGPFQVPIPLGYYKSLNLVLYEDYPGIPLTNYIVKNRGNVKYMVKQSALWLARLHNMKIKKGIKKKLPEIKNEINYFIDDYKNNFPDVYAIGATILEQIFPLFKNEVFNRKNTFILTHGDPNPNNVIINKDKVAIIDWGRSYAYDPLSDVANYLAQLNMLTWFFSANSRVIRNARKIFLDNYLKATGQKLKKIQRRLMIHELWWIMQIIAYIVSTRDPNVVRPAVIKNMEQAKKLCRKLKIRIDKQIISDKKTGSLKEIFTDEKLMLKLFNKSLRRLFPEERHIISLKISHPEALSETSFLTRTKLTMVNKKNKQIEKIVRGNTIDADTYKLMKFIFENNKKNLISPRPLHYFARIPYILYEETPGKRLREISFKSNLFKILLRKTAISLATLHNLPLPKVRTTKIKEVSYFKEVRAKIKKYDPANYKVISSYTREYLKTASIKFKGSKKVLSHNDLQASNIIVTPKNEIALIDFTLSSLFFPSFDVANFLVHLRIMLKGVISHKKINQLQNIFLNNYLKTVKKSLGRQVEKNVKLAQVRAALDIWTITATLMGAKDKNRHKYVKILNNIIKENLLCQK